MQNLLFNDISNCLNDFVKLPNVNLSEGKLRQVFIAVAGENLNKCTDCDVAALRGSDLNLIEGYDNGYTLGCMLNAYSIVNGLGYIDSDNLTWLYRSFNSGQMPDIVEDLRPIVLGADYVSNVVEGSVGESVSEELYEAEEPSVEEVEESDEVHDEEAIDDDVDDDVAEEELNNKAVMYLSFIKNKVVELLQTYDTLYKPCYEGNKPKGILTPEGLFTFNGQVKGLNEESRAELSVVYSVIEQRLGTLDGVTRFNSHVSPKTLEKTTGIPLFPMYHLSNMYGYFGGRSDKCTSYSEFRNYIEKRTINILKGIVNKLPEEMLQNDRLGVEQVILQYLASIKTCILVDDYKPGVILKLRISLDSSIYANEFVSLNKEPFQKVINEGYMFRRDATIDIPERVNDVIYINFIVDAETYYNAPLFAYESLPILKQQGVKLSWDNILIGKDTKDNLVFGHFGAQQKTIYNILAGSGSGKGVMTLNLLASALASNIPVMYADCKPDMARVLWEVAEGREVLAFDGDDTGTLKQVEDRVNIYQWFNTEVPEELRQYLAERGLQKKFVKAYSYIRCLHLAYLISVMRKEKGVNSDDYILFIFDEIGRLSERIMDLTLALRGEGETPKEGFIYERTLKLKAEGLKREAITNDPAIVYADGFINYCIGVIGKIVDAKTAELRLSNSKLLFIWQPDWLEKGSLGNIKSRFNKYYFLSVVYKLTNDDNTVKFAGKGASKSDTLGMKPLYDKSELNVKLFDNYRYFAMSESGTITEDSTLFRPFLLLNNSSPEEAKKVCATNYLAVDKVYKDGQIVPEIGFPEYVNKLLDGNVKEPLCRSWGIAQEALKELGYEPDIYKFMYDVSDIRLNLGGVVNTFDSTMEKRTKGIDPTYTEILQVYSQEDDFQDEDYEDAIEYAAAKNIFGEYSDDLVGKIFNSEDIDWDEEIDLGATDVENTSAESLKQNSDIAFTDAVKEAESLINRLKELGVNVELQGKKPIEGTEQNGFYAEVPKDMDEASFGMSRRDSKSSIEIPKGVDLIGNPENAWGVLSVLVTKDLVKSFGGTSNIKTIAFIGGGVAVNKKFYRCNISKNNLEIPYEFRREINAGNVAKLINMNVLLKLPNLQSIVCDSKDFWLDNVVEVAANYSENVEGQSTIVNQSRALFRVVPTLRFIIVGNTKLTRENLDNDLEAWDKTLNWSIKSRKIGDSIQSACFKGASKSWEMNKMVVKSNKNVFLKGLGLIAGTAGTVVSGGAGVGIVVGKGIVNGLKGFAGGIKNLIDN